MTMVELCCGTAVVSLFALGGASRAAQPGLVGYMGGKRRWAGDIAALLGAGDQRPDHVLLVDAGPWGDVWSTLASPLGRAATAGHLTGWAGMDPSDLWSDLVSRPPALSPSLRAAQYLWIQARSASGIPVWWDHTRCRWEAPSSSRASRRACQKQRGRGGILDPRTVAQRIMALDTLDWGRVEVIHGDARDIAPIPGASLYIDPPYDGAPRYASVLPRDAVVSLIGRWSAAGCRVLVSEREPIPLQGWSSMRLPARRPEWLSANFILPSREQHCLFPKTLEQP